MRSKFFVMALLLAALVILNACDALGGGGTNARPTPTPPGPTAMAEMTEAPQPTEQAGEGGGRGAIGGNIFNDQNGNGTLDAGEPVIAGVHVLLGGGACPSQGAAETVSIAEQPSYRFNRVRAGDYCVMIDPQLPANQAILGMGQWTSPPPPTSGQAVVPVQLTGGEDQLDLNFGWLFAVIGQATPPPADQGTPPAPGEATPMPLLPTPTQFVEPTGAAQACTYSANYVADATVPDGQVMLPGTQFVKTWRVRNSGSCPWGPGSGLQNLQFINGDPLGAPNLVPISNAIPAGAEGDLSINMVAPAQPGAYRSSWKLRADNGALIGVGPSNVALFASIQVQPAPQPTSPAPPTNVPVPTTVAVPVQPIVFAAGATEAEAQGQLAANQIATYSVSAQANQTMQLSLSSNSSSARIAVLSPTGVPISPQRGNPEGTYWQGNLPTNGNYIIQVLAGNASPTANYSLNVTIPVRINFAPGAISASVQGTTSNGRIVTYLLKASEGQTMSVNLTAPPNSAGITVYGLDDGQPLIRSQSGATSMPPTPLPATQDYVIQVVPFGNTTVDYTLEVTVQ